MSICTRFKLIHLDEHWFPQHLLGHCRWCNPAIISSWLLWLLPFHRFRHRWKPITTQHSTNSNRTRNPNYFFFFDLFSPLSSLCTFLSVYLSPSLSEIRRREEKGMGIPCMMFLRNTIRWGFRILGVNTCRFNKCFVLLFFFITRGYMP